MFEEFLMTRRSRPRGRALFTAASLSTFACSLLAPPDERYLNPGHSGGKSAASGGAPLEGGARTMNGGAAASVGSPLDGGRGNAENGGQGAGAEDGTSTGGAFETGGASSGGASSSGASSSGGAGESGAAGAPPTCTPTSCDASARCVVTEGSVRCVCESTLIPEGRACRLPASCKELHATSPSLASGPYSIKPALATRAEKVYCDMRESGGGWTLLLNEGVDFMPKTPGTDDALCYEQNCTSAVYSSLTVSSDVLLDIANENIVRESHVARIRVLGVNSASRGKTLREMFTNGPYFLERGDNSNVTVFTRDGQTCEDALPRDFATLFCDTCARTDQQCGKPILTMGDADSFCNSSIMFALGASESESESWTNCAGWPQRVFLTNTDSTVQQYYPTNVRVWVR